MNEVLDKDSYKCISFIEKNRLFKLSDISFKRLNFIYSNIKDSVDYDLKDTNNIDKVKKSSDNYTMFELHHKKKNDKEFFKYLIENQRYIGTLAKFEPDNKIFKLQHRHELNKLLYSNRFVAFNIQHDAETTDLIYDKYKGDTIIFHLYYNKHNKIDVNETFIIYDMMKRLTKNNTKLNLVIYSSGLKKHLIHDIKSINPYNINSGSCLPRSFINIWRKEEWRKVLMHELIHFYELENGNYDSINKYIKQTFKIDGKIKPYEAYTEALAVIIHSVYVSKTIGKRKFKSILSHEINHSLFQCAKILKHFGMKQFNDIYSTRIKQSTSMFSYFIIKTAMLFNTDKFIDFISSNLKYNNRSAKLLNIIKESFNNTKFKDCIDKYIKLDVDGIFIRDNLRFSCVELK